jgi:hypothetical protein
MGLAALSESFDGSVLAFFTKSPAKNRCNAIGTKRLFAFIAGLSIGDLRVYRTGLHHVHQGDALPEVTTQTILASP